MVYLYRVNQGQSDPDFLHHKRIRSDRCFYLDISIRANLDEVVGFEIPGGMN